MYDLLAGTNIEFYHGSIDLSVQSVDSILNFSLRKKAFKMVPRAPIVDLATDMMDDTARLYEENEKIRRRNNEHFNLVGNFDNFGAF